MLITNLILRLIFTVQGHTNDLKNARSVILDQLFPIYHSAVHKKHLRNADFLRK